MWDVEDAQNGVAPRTEVRKHPNNMPETFSSNRKKIFWEGNFLGNMTKKHCHTSCQ